MSEIKILNLINGPPIIAKIETNTKSQTCVLEDPFNILYTKQEADEPKFSVFEMLILSADSTIEVAKDKILFSYTPLPEIVDQYNTMLLNKFIPIDD